MKDLTLKFFPSMKDLTLKFFQSIKAQVHITDSMMPGVVSLPHGWGHNRPGARLQVAAKRPGANLNDLLNDQLRDPLSGNAVLSGIAVQISAI